MTSNTKKYDSALSVSEYLEQVYPIGKLRTEEPFIVRTDNIARSFPLYSECLFKSLQCFYLHKHNLDDFDIFKVKNPRKLTIEEIKRDQFLFQCGVRTKSDISDILNNTDSESYNITLHWIIPTTYAKSVDILLSDPVTFDMTYTLKLEHIELLSVWAIKDIINTEISNFQK